MHFSRFPYWRARYHADSATPELHMCMRANSLIRPMARSSLLLAVGVYSGVSDFLMFNEPYSAWATSPVNSGALSEWSSQGALTWLNTLFSASTESDLCGRPCRSVNPSQD